LLGVPTGWSLTVEMCFYLVAPVLLLGLRGRLRGLPVVALGLLAVGAGIAQLAPRLPWYGYFMQPFSFILVYTFFGRGAEFLAGMGLAFWLKRRGDRPARRGTTLLGLALIAGCVTGMAVGSAGYQPLENWPTPMLPILINNFLLPGSIVVLFYGLIHERTWFQWLLETRLFDLLGKSSYAFYLVHIGLFSDLLDKSIGQNSFVYFVLFNIAAILLYQWVEHPLHLYILKRFSRPARAAGALKGR
jgi:peptidoglycan/LPS O-acetylase OafA/YrhL